MKFSTLLVLSLLLTAPLFSQIQISLALLRSTATASTTQPYLITDAGREGIFFYDSKDVSTPDNGGTVVVNGSKRYKRIYSGPLDVKWFGAKSDWNGSSGTDNHAAIVAAINAATRNQVVMIPNGGYYVSKTIALPLTTAKKVYFEIFGDIYFAKGGGFIVEGANQSFKSYGMIAGGNVGATTEAGYAAYTGTGVYIKNAFQSEIEVNEVKDFKYGIHMSGDKSGGSPNGCQYNKVKFNVIHHCHTQIRISTIGSTDLNGNWNNSSFWYGGQLGRGAAGSYGKGGWYGVHFIKDATSNAGDPMNGHMFHDVGFEGVEKAIVMSNAYYNSFFGGRFEGLAIREGINLDPVTAVANKFVGHFAMVENLFVNGRHGVNTIISGTPLWSGTTNQVLMGSDASNSVTPNKLLVTTNKYSYTNFMVNKTHDLISQTGQFPTIQAMMYRIDGVIRAVPFKKTFFHVKTTTAGTPLTLPPNIGMLRVEANQAKVFKIDAGDLAANGEELLVEYLTPAFPISFIRSDNSAVLMASTLFPSGGTYRCLWTDGVFKVSKIGEEYKTQSYSGSTFAVPEGIQTVLGNSTSAPSIVTLPPAASWPGREITIKNIQAGKNIQVNGISASDENIIPGRGAVTVKSDGTTWNIIHFYKRNITY
jgi:hypothetical protein